MKWHVEIEARHDGQPVICHFFPEARNRQEAARKARLRFTEEHAEGQGAEYVRCQLVEPDTGILVF